ncbi:hypothetical protein PPOP_0815 [Paenibacillus popilliae ATCC 14706]|uniref:Uncharacterized protein n=1 Tax=Paenibacillus popilliae ATCC 14706 TaxID=1212764 RepID=M9LG57_PAEPP|nr:hypothetical protein PPOP_0815 [Paenibacillus popilliae ATCC 14706]
MSLDVSVGGNAFDISEYESSLSHSERAHAYDNVELYDESGSGNEPFEDEAEASVETGEL